MPQIKQSAIVSQSIKDLLQETGIKTKRTAISLGGSAVITKKIQIAVMTELDLEDQIALEAEEYIPFDIEEVYLDFQIISQDKESMDVLLTACKKDLVNSHTDVVRQAGLDPRICDLDLFCLSNAYQHFIQAEESGAVILVHVGAALLNIAIMNTHGNPGYIRDHAFGGRLLVSEENWLADRSDRDKQHPELVNFQTEIINPFLDQLHQQINQALHFYKTSNPDSSITGVWISGGCALLPGVVPFFVDKLGLPVRIADPFVKLKQTTHPMAPLAPRFMVALGLALRGDIP